MKLLPDRARREAKGGGNNREAERGESHRALAVLWVSVE